MKVTWVAVCIMLSLIVGNNFNNNNNLVVLDRSVKVVACSTFSHFAHEVLTRMSNCSHNHKLYKVWLMGYIEQG